MKKFLWLFALVIMPTVVFADDFGYLFTGKIELGDSFGAGTNQIFESQDFSRPKLSPMGIPSWGAFLINVAAGAGIGSYIQGDILGGTIGLVGELGGLGLILGGYFSIVDFSTGEFKEDYQTGMGLMIGGTVVLLGARIFECIRPWFYGRNKDYAFNFTPSVDINGNPTAVASLSIKLRQ